MPFVVVESILLTVIGSHEIPAIAVCGREAVKPGAVLRLGSIRQNARANELLAIRRPRTGVGNFGTPSGQREGGTENRIEEASGLWKTGKTGDAPVAHSQEG